MSVRGGQVLSRRLGVKQIPRFAFPSSLWPRWIMSATPEAEWLQTQETVTLPSTNATTPVINISPRTEPEASVAMQTVVCHGHIRRLNNLLTKYWRMLPYHVLVKTGGCIVIVLQDKMVKQNREGCRKEGGWWKHQERSCGNSTLASSMSVSTLGHMSHLPYPTS